MKQGTYTIIKGRLKKERTEGKERGKIQMKGAEGQEVRKDTQIRISRQERRVTDEELKKRE